MFSTLQCYSFRNETKEDEETSRWNQFLVKALTTSPIDSRAFRAGVIYNPLRGLTLNEMNNNLKDVNNKDGMIMMRIQYHFHEFYFPGFFFKFQIRTSEILRNLPKPTQKGFILWILD